MNDQQDSKKKENKNMSLNLSLPTAHVELKPRITVIGVGGAGGNAVNNMIRSKLEGVEFVVANTDAQALSQSVADTRIQLGTGVTQGLGAGSRPDIGRAAAEETLEHLIDSIGGSHMVFIAAGMGGGTGTGAAPVIARAARDQGMLTVGVVTKPFNFEGQHRMRLAEQGIAELQQHVDTLIIIPNQNLFRIANERTTFAEAFKLADDVLYSGVRGVTDLMIMPGLINLDFADIRSVMSEMGKAMMGTGEAEGDTRAVDAAQKAISNPLLDDVSMKGARGVLINITGGPDMTLFEVDEAANRIRDEVDPDANIIFGSTFDESMAGRMRVSVVATGIDAARVEQGDRPNVVTIAAKRAAQAQAQAQRAAPRAEALVAATPPAPVATPAPAPLVAQREPAPMVAAPPLPQRPAAAAQTQAPIATPPAPQVAARSEPAFIPPKPVEPQLPPVVHKDQPSPVNPLDAAALANGGLRVESVPAGEKRIRRGISLFQQVTGIGMRKSAPAQPAPASEAAQRPEPHIAPPAAARPTPTPPQPPVQPKLGGLDTAPTPTPSQSQEDLLDIPAFLRRQAN
jgi:cell division protein FtsZ